MTGQLESSPLDVSHDGFLDLVPRSARPRRLMSGAAWTEGPVWVPEGDYVLFSDIPNDRLLRWSESQGGSVALQPAGFMNGHTLDLDGRVICCEHGERRITRLEPDGSVVALAERYGGRRLNSPNDVVVKSDGTIWFTDPPYGILSDREGHKAESELGDNYVFRFDPVEGELTVATDLVEEPNGLAFSPDERLLYVSDTSAALRSEGGNHHIVAFDVQGGRYLANARVFAEIAPGIPDGFRVDVHGNVFTSAGDGIQVFAPDANLLGKILIPETVSNCVFGGPDLTRLYITATSSLYAIDLTTQGAVRRPLEKGD
jgi:gluconolactonase